MGQSEPCSLPGANRAGQRKLGANVDHELHRLCLCRGTVPRASVPALFALTLFFMPSPLLLGSILPPRPSGPATKSDVSHDNQTAVRPTSPSIGHGIEQVYLDLLEEAKRRSELDFAESHQRGKRGVVIGPVDGDFIQTLKSLQNARRIRNISPREEAMRIALITSKEHVRMLGTCNKSSHMQRPKEVTDEACRLWANGTLFDDVLMNQEPPWVNESHASQSQGNGRYWMMSLSGAILAPYKETLILDSDAYPCPGFEKLFAMLWPYSKKLWALPSTAVVDIAFGMDQYPVSGGEDFRLPGDSGIYTDFEYFSERNTGTSLWNFHRKLSHTFAHFVPLVAEHMYNHVATPNNVILHDQVPMRVALYLFKKLNPSYNEQNLPSHVSCRSYPAKDYAGIDGARNGMYPVQSDGKICSECHCTPCLINHLHTVHFVNVNGKKGWEDSNFIEGGSNSLPADY